jgi:hypothetical protein
MPWARLGRLQAVVLKEYSLKSRDMPGLSAISSTLASLELGLSKGEAVMQVVIPN